MKHIERQQQAHGAHSEPSRSTKPRTASRFDAGTGQGTVSEPHYGDTTLDHPVLDGSTLGPEAERAVDNPWRGITDPELRRHPEQERS